MVSHNSSFRELSLSKCSLVAWGIDETVFEFVCGWIGDGDSSCQFWRCSTRERGMVGSGGIGMGTGEVSDGGDGDLVGCCDEFVDGVGGGNDNYGMGCDDGVGDGVCNGGFVGTDECGADGDVVGLAEGSNVGYGEGYRRGEACGRYGDDDDGLQR